MYIVVNQLMNSIELCKIVNNRLKHTTEKDRSHHYHSQIENSVLENSRILYFFSNSVKFGRLCVTTDETANI